MTRIRSISFHPNQPGARRPGVSRPGFRGLGIAIACCIWLALLCDTTVATERLLGDRAEDFTLKSASGENVRLREQRGKVILLVFWASHCQHCQRQLQALNALHDRYATDGFVVWAVSLDHHAEVAIEQARRWQLKHQILFDPDHAITRLYRVNDVPTALLLDRDGRVQKLFNGFHPNELPQYEASLLAILK